MAVTRRLNNCTVLLILSLMIILKGSTVVSSQPFTSDDDGSVDALEGSGVGDEYDEYQKYDEHGEYEGYDEAGDANGGTVLGAVPPESGADGEIVGGGNEGSPINLDGATGDATGEGDGGDGDATGRNDGAMTEANIDGEGDTTGRNGGVQEGARSGTPGTLDGEADEEDKNKAGKALKLDLLLGISALCFFHFAVV